MSLDFVQSMPPARPWRTVLCALLKVVGCSVAAAGTPWLEPGDAGLRRDIALLADEGLIDVPVTVWPMSWPAIARAVQAIPPDITLRPASLAALRRVRGRADFEARKGWSREARIAGAARPTKLRTFADTPREAGRSWRAHLEWSDTNPDCAPGSGGCAYRGGPYQAEGYSTIAARSATRCSRTARCIRWV